MYTSWKEAEKSMKLDIVSTVHHNLKNHNLNQNQNSGRTDGHPRRQLDRKLEQVDNNTKGDLAEALQPLLLFGKIIGLIPFSKYRWNYILILPLLSVCIVVELVNFFMTSSSRKTPLDLASSLGILFFYSSGIVIYSYLYKSYSTFKKLVHNWKLLNSNNKKDVRLYRDVNLCAFLIFFSAIGENIIFHLKLCSSDRNPIENSNVTRTPLTTDSFLECSYRKMYPSWHSLIPHNDGLAILLIISNKLSLYAWNYIDVLIFVISRALYFRFDDFVQQPANPTLWKFKLRSDYNELLQMLDALEDFLSPLIFTSYCLNTYSLCMQLNLWLTPSKNNTILDSVYSIWSSLHLVLRVLLVSLSAARVHDSADKIQKLIQACPATQYTLEMVRLEDMVATTKIGLSGLGCFVITKRFILSIISVIFTFEVVLLQSVDPSPGTGCPTV